MVSRDQGESFGRPISMARDPDSQIYYWDQRLCAGRQPGEFVGLYWTHNRARQKELNVHLPIGTIEPDGCNGPHIRATTLSGRIAVPLLLSEGRLFCVVVERTG